ARPIPVHLAGRKRMDRLGTKISRPRDRCGMATVPSPTRSDFSRCDLVLFAEIDLAAPSHLHLSALERRSVTSAYLCSTRRSGDCCDSSGRRTKGSTASSILCLCLFRHRAFADPRLFRCLFFSLL